jgi:hypothetical protein
MKKMRTDTVMGEDLEKIFKKLKTVSGEENINLDEQKKVIQKKFESAARKQRLKIIILSAVIIVCGALYWYCK